MYSIWYRHSISGCALHWLISAMQTSVMHSHSYRVMVPDAVHIPFDLLKMSIIMLETCRGL